MTERHSSRIKIWHQVASLRLLVMAGIILQGLFILLILNGIFGNERWLLKVTQEQVPVIIGLPIAGLCSSFVVLLFNKVVPGEIELKFTNLLERKGPAAPIMLWVVCFFIISICIKMLWN